MEAVKLIAELQLVLNDIEYVQREPYGRFNFQPSQDINSSWETMKNQILRTTPAPIRDALLKAFFYLNTRPATTPDAHKHFGNMIATMRAAIEFLLLFKSATPLTSNDTPKTRIMTTADVMTLRGQDGQVASLEKTTFGPSKNGLSPMPASELATYTAQAPNKLPLGKVGIVAHFNMGDILGYYVAETVGYTHTLMLTSAGMQKYTNNRVEWDRPVEDLLAHAINCLTPVHKDPQQNTNPVGIQFERLEFDMKRRH